MKSSKENTGLFVSKRQTDIKQVTSFLAKILRAKCKARVRASTKHRNADLRTLRGYEYRTLCLGPFSQREIVFKCKDSSAVRFLGIDLMVSGSNPLTPKLSLRVRRVASSL